MRWALCVALLVGCGDDTMGTGGSGGVGGTGGVGGAGGTGGTGGGHVADVVGTTIVNYVTDSGEMPRPVDVTAFAPKAIVLTTGQTINGTGDANGNFMIPQVPDGALVQYGENFVQLGAGRTLDFGYDQLGRPDVAHATMSGTQINLQLSLMAPWANDDMIELISSNAGAVRRLDNDPTVQNPPAPTATDLNMTVDLLNQPLVDSTKGDHEIIAQLVHRMSSTNLGYVSADKNAAANIANYDESDGMITHVMGVFDATTATSSVTLDWRRSQFEALKSSVHAGAVSHLQGVFIDVEPGGLTHGVFSNTVDMVAVMPTLGATDLNYGSVSYDNPYPSTWGVFGQVVHEFEVDYMLPGTATPAAIIGRIAWQANLTQFTSGPVVPAVSPPVGLTVNVSGGMTLTWSAPALGTPTNYVILLHKLTANGNQTTERVVARFFVSGESLRLPSSVLTMGSSYVIEVQAVAIANVDLVQKPFRVALPMGVASAFTDIVTP